MSDNPINAINDRLQKGDERFQILNDVLQEIKAHLKRQDKALSEVNDKLDKVAKGTEDVVAMWNGGVKAVRFFCRLAEAWRFIIRQMALPIGAFFFLVYGLVYLFSNGHFPLWFGELIKLISGA